jgi:hypothetical protein
MYTFPERPSAVLPAPHGPGVLGFPGPSPPEAPPTPLFTRHMLGAIESERERRGAFGAARRRPVPGRTMMPHPKLDAALAAQERRRTQARMDLSRWADEGGRFDPEAAARLRIGDREMKRCNS